MKLCQVDGGVEAAMKQVPVQTDDASEMQDREGTVSR